jgi:hypothetical protein
VSLRVTIAVPAVFLRVPRTSGSAFGASFTEDRDVQGRDSNATLGITDLDLERIGSVVVWLGCVDQVCVTAAISDSAVRGLRDNEERKRVAINVGRDRCDVSRRVLIVVTD